MCAHPVNGEIKTAADAAAADPLLRDLLYFDMLKRGFYLARRGFIALSLATATTRFGGSRRRWRMCCSSVPISLSRRARHVGAATLARELEIGDE